MTDIIKQVLVVNKALKMRQGKTASQCAHASMGCLLKLMQPKDTGHKSFKLKQLTYTTGGALDLWLDDAFTKIVVYCESDEELLALHKKAEQEWLLNCLITDCGKTEFKGVSTRTVLAIGPDYSSKIDPITGHLKLL